MAIRDYNVSAALNTAISGINIGEGSARADVNNAIRQLMADIAADAAVRIPTRAAMAAIASPSVGMANFLTEAGRDGLFVFDSSDLSAKVTLDTRQGIYIAPSSASTGASGAWVRKYTGPIDIRWFGAVPGTTSDQKAAIQGALNVAEGSPVLIPLGQWRIDSGLSTTDPVYLVGEGMGAGPGAVSTTDCSMILANFLSGDLLSVVSLYGSTIKGLHFSTNVGLRLSGAAIHLSGDGLASTGSNSVIEECSFNQQYEDIRLTRYIQARIERTYHQGWGSYAIVNATTGGFEPGGGYIAHNYFAGSTTASTTQSGCILTRAGYAWIHDNLILGAQVGIKVDISEYDLAFPSIHHNSIEEQDIYGIYITGANSKVIGLLDVSFNEFSVTTTRANYTSCVQVDNASYTIENADFTGNCFRCNSGNASFRYFNLQNGNRIRVVSNVITHLAGNGSAVFLGGGTLASGEIRNNSVNIVAGTLPKYSGVNLLRVYDYEGTTFANLPSVANGSVIYCTDGTFANPVAGGGTGCFAKRLNGAWRGD